MIEKMMNLMKMQASLMTSGVAQTVLGQVINYDPVSYAAQVKLYEADENDPNSQPLTTGWLPIGVIAKGVWAAPNIGDLVLVHFQEGSIQNGYISLAYDSNAPPQPVPSGTIYISSQNPVNVVAPIVNINSSQVNIGNLNNAVTALLNGLARTVYNGHTHNDPVSGVTGVPNQPMDSTTLTTNIKAN